MGRSEAAFRGRSEAISEGRKIVAVLLPLRKWRQRSVGAKPRALPCSPSVPRTYLAQGARQVPFRGRAADASVSQIAAQVGMSRTSEATFRGREVSRISREQAQERAKQKGPRPR